MNVPNTTALIFAMGYQGGTVHQVAADLGVTTSDILNADADRMGDLLRLAQAYRNSRDRDVVPGYMHCAKCKFHLSRTNLYMQSGTTGPGDNKTEPCPNGCGPLWPVSWKDHALDLEKSVDKMTPTYVVDKLAAVLRRLIKQTPFRPSKSGLDVQLSFEQIKEQKDALAAYDALQPNEKG